MTILPSEASGPPWAVRWTQGPVYGLQALDTEGLDRLRGPQLNLPEGQGWWRLPDPQPSQRPRVRADIGKATAVVPPSPDLTGQINGIDIPRIDAAFLYPMGTEAPWLRAEWMGLLNLSCGVEAVELGLLVFRGREPTPFCPLWRGALPTGTFRWSRRTSAPTSGRPWCWCPAAPPPLPGCADLVRRCFRHRGSWFAHGRSPMIPPDVAAKVRCVLLAVVTEREDKLSDVQILCIGLYRHLGESPVEDRVASLCQRLGAEAYWLLDRIPDPALLAAHAASSGAAAETADAAERGEVPLEDVLVPGEWASLSDLPGVLAAGKVAWS